MIIDITKNLAKHKHITYFKRSEYDKDNDILIKKICNARYIYKRSYIYI